MHEELLVYALLFSVGFPVGSDYAEHLNTLFLETPDNEMLLELQWCSSDTSKTISIIRHHLYGHIIDYDVFGRFMFAKLENIYRQEIMSIDSFSQSTYAIWAQLPDSIHYEEPFYVLNHAGDALSWGDEIQTREIFEETFRFYDNK